MSRELHCSFCGQSEHRVEKLVGGPGVYICDTCIAIASRIISEDGAGSTRAPLWRRAVVAARRVFRGLRHGALLESARGHAA